MANFCSGVKVRLFGGAAGSMSSSVTSSFWARSIKGVELVKVMVSVLPVSPWREERLRQVSHVSLTDRALRIPSRRIFPVRYLYCRKAAKRDGTRRYAKGPNCWLACWLFARPQSVVRGHEEVPGYGQLRSPLVATKVPAFGHEKSPPLTEVST